VLIYLVSYFKFSKDPKKIFERIDFQTWHSTLELAREESKRNFDDEAGWYEGILIEERKENTIFYRGLREFYILNDKEEFELIPIPHSLKNQFNLI